MKKIRPMHCFFIFVIMVFLGINSLYEAYAKDSLQVIQLSDPKAQFAKHTDSLLYALENRQSGRVFSNSSLDIEELSALLWAACGQNRNDGKLTIPTSRNSQDMYVYLAKDDGVWLYNAQNHSIEQISTIDIRSKLSPALAKKAPVTFFYVNDTDKATRSNSGDRHSGSMYQNVGLYCAIANLNNVVTGSFSSDINMILNLPKNYKVMIAQCIGGKS